MGAFSALLNLFEDAQLAMAQGLPTSDFGPLIELLDGPRQREVQASARAELLLSGAIVGAPAMPEDFE